MAAAAAGSCDHGAAGLVLAGALCFSKFVKEIAAMYYELRKAGTSAYDGGTEAIAIKQNFNIRRVLETELSSNRL
jgi:hypothetical protein